MAKSQPLDKQEFLRLLGEKLNRQAKKPDINGYVPHAKQLDFHSSPAKHRLYVGGNRSGKTYGNVAECLLWSRKQHPYREIPVPDWEPCRGRFCTPDYIHGLEQIALPIFSSLTPPSMLKSGSWEESYNKGLRVLTFSNGSTIDFLSYENDLDKFAGTSRHFVAYDEEPPEAIYTENLARLVDTNGHEWFSLTPLEGMSWIYDTLFLPGRDGNPQYHNTIIEMYENPHLDKAAIDEFLGSLTEEEQQVRVGGNFIEIGGLIYKKFDPKPGGLHVLNRIIKRFPKQVPIAVSLDHGYNNPTAVLWHAILPEGNIITFNERYIRGEIVKSHALAIHQFNRTNGLKPDIWVADPSIKNTDPLTGTSIQQEYAKYGIYFTLANNDVVAGIERVQSYIDPGKNSAPRWKITEDCTNTIKEMSRYKWKSYASKKLASQNNRFDVPHKKDDHACDSLRYFLMSQPELDHAFAFKNPSPDLSFVDDSVKMMGGDFTVKSIQREEWERALSSTGEYVSSGDDLMGGYW